MCYLCYLGHLLCVHIFSVILIRVCFLNVFEVMQENSTCIKHFSRGVTCLNVDDLNVDT